MRFWRAQLVRELDADLLLRKQASHAEYQHRVADAPRRYTQSVTQAWQQCQQEINTNVVCQLHDANTFLGLIGADWDRPAWRQFPPTDKRSVPGGVRVGSYNSRGSTLGVEAPSLLPLIGCQSALFVSGAAGSQAVNRVLRSVVLLCPSHKINPDGQLVRPYNLSATKRADTVRRYQVQGEIDRDAELWYKPANRIADTL